MPDPEGKRARPRAAAGLERVEELIYFAVAVALAVVGVVLFGHAVIAFVTSVTEPNFEDSVLGLLDSLLLVFIVAELIHTVRTVIAENVLRTEPFLIVGIVAAIRRLLVISVEATAQMGKDTFSDLMTEMGLLVVSIVGLGLVIFMLRHTDQTEPHPDEREADEEADAGSKGD